MDRLDALRRKAEAKAGGRVADEAWRRVVEEYEKSYGSVLAHGEAEFVEEAAANLCWVRIGTSTARARFERAERRVTYKGALRRRAKVYEEILIGRVLGKSWKEIWSEHNQRHPERPYCSVASMKRTYRFWDRELWPIVSRELYLILFRMRLKGTLPPAGETVFNFLDVMWEEYLGCPMPFLQVLALPTDKRNVCQCLAEVAPDAVPPEFRDRCQLCLPSRLRWRKQLEETAG
jgi:hypothetical protein